jgi:hypothetical protein
LINVPAGLVILPLVFARLRGEWREAERRRFDVAGSTAYAVALACLLYGFSTVPSARGIVLVAAGLAGLVMFVRMQRRSDAPLLPIALLYENRAFAFSNLAAMINYSATFAVGFFLSLYLQNVKGMSPSAAGTVLVVQPIVQAALSPLSGRLSDRIEPRILASLGMAASATGLVVRLAGDALVVRAGLSRLARRRLRAVLVAEHERRAFVGGARSARRRQRDARDDAQRGHDVLDGIGAPRTVAVRRPRADLSRDRGALPGRAPRILRRVLGALLRGDLRVARARQRAQS